MTRSVWGLTLLMVLFFVQPHLIHAQDNWGKLAQAKLTLEESLNVSTDSKIQFSTALERLEEKFDISFMYKTGLFEGAYAPSNIGKSDNLTYELQKLLEPYSLKYTRLNNRTFTISLDFSKYALRLREKTQEQIEGIVTDASSGESLPGVNVVVKGTTTGTSTDSEGYYELTVPSLQDTLMVSFVGYQTKEVPIDGRTEINITLQAQAITGEELVVVGYGTAKRSDLVGSVGSVQTEDIERQPSVRLDQALQGTSPGMIVQNNSAQPGGKTSIRIRGVNSIQGSNDPLVVIDGFIGGDLSSVNPGDIESIEVLKDAASTAIYGSRGANGVILVTTKKGASGPTTVQYNNYFNFKSVSKKMDLLNAAQYAETVNANRVSTGGNPVFTQSEIEEFRQNGGTDWQDQIFRNTLEQNHDISISGGADNVNYYLSGNFNDNAGVVKGSSYKRYSVRSNIEADVSDRFSVGLNVYLSKSESDSITTGSNQDEAITHAALVWAPTKDVYTEDGGYTQPGGGHGPPAVFNPLALAVEPIDERLASRNELNGSFDYEFIDGLTARVSFGTRVLDVANNFYYNTKPRGGVGEAQAGISDTRALILQNTNQLTYQNVIAGVHDFNVTAVFEQQSENFHSNFSGSNGFTTDAVTYNNLALGQSPQTPTSSKTERQIQSYVGRVNYTYDGKYIFSLTGRQDGSSVFGEDNKWGFFPSAAVAWRADNERFMEDVEQISNLKLRTSYGIIGSQAVSPYSSLSTLNTNAPYPIGGSGLSPGVGLGTLGNPELKWETTSQFNVGLDLGLFEDRLDFTAEYYKKVTSDLLFNIPLPTTSGYDSVLRNIGEVQNQGIEFTLGGYPISGDNLQWNTNLNLAINRNKVLSLASGEESVPLGGPGFPNFGNTVFLEIGEPIGVLKGYIQEGTWNTDEEAEANSYGSIPGAPKYVDQNNDGAINSQDIAKMGSTLPKFSYGWSNTFSYKNLDLNVFIQGTQGNDVYNLSRPRSERSSSDSDATDVRILNRWTPDNQDTDVPSFEGSARHEFLQSSRWLEDGSYLRVKTITLGYNLPASLLGDVSVSSARIYVSGSNIFTFTNYTGYDPEASTGVDAFGGIDIGSYPNQKMYTVGVNISF